MDAAHPLFKPVGVPRDVVVEQDMAALEVDAFACRLGATSIWIAPSRNCCSAVEAGAGSSREPGFMPPWMTADSEAPSFSLLNEIVEGVLELGERSEPLVGRRRIPALASRSLSRRVWPRRRRPRRPSPAWRAVRAPRSPRAPVGIPGERDRFEHLLKPLTFAFLHLLDFFGIGEVGRGRARQLLGVLQALLETPGAVFKRMPHGVRAGGQPALVERHEETDGARARVVALRGGRGALVLHEAGDVAVQIEFGAIDLEIHRVRDALGEDLARHPCAVGLPLGEVDHRLFGAAQVEGRTAPVHRFADRLHVGIGIRVEQLEEQAEIGRVALVRRRGQQQNVVASVPQQLAQRVARSLPRRRRPRHAVGLIHDDEVPMRPAADRARSHPASQDPTT